MDINQEKAPTVVSHKTPPESDPTKIDRNTPATDDSGVEAMDEVPPLQEADAIIHGDPKKAGEAVIQDHKKK
jgi:hypothetical protein